MTPNPIDQEVLEQIKENKESKVKNNKSEYNKYKLYIDGAYIGYIAIYGRDNNVIRDWFENRNAYIEPIISHYQDVSEFINGEYVSRGEGDYLAHFELATRKNLSIFGKMKRWLGKS